MNKCIATVWVNTGICYNLCEYKPTTGANQAAVQSQVWTFALNHHDIVFVFLQ